MWLTTCMRVSETERERERERERESNKCNEGKVEYGISCSFLVPRVYEHAPIQDRAR